jgi:hypothetical protein
MNSYTELSKYFYKDISDIITEYMEDDWSFYKVNILVGRTSVIRNYYYSPIICRGIRLEDSLYYIGMSLQEIKGNTIRNINIPLNPLHITVCNEKFLLVIYGRFLSVYNREFRLLHDYTIYNLKKFNFCSYGSSVYLAGIEWEELWNTYFHPNSRGQIVKLRCNEDGELSGVKVVRVSSSVRILAANINYLCVRIGNKVIIYHADTLSKVASVNIGIRIQDAVIKGNNLILRTGYRYDEIRINLSDFKKKVMREKLRLLELPNDLVVNKN